MAARPLILVLFGLAMLGAGSMAMAKPRTPPPGSYQTSCTQIALSNAGVLTASCRTVGNMVANAALKISDCGKGDIANRDGRLVCPPAIVPKAKGSPAKAAPPATEAESWVTLYTEINYGGRSLDLHGDTASLLVGLNDTASSIRLHGAGRWQICADAGYRGRCAIVVRDTPNLTRFGLNNKVSSVRRVGPDASLTIRRLN